LRRFGTERASGFVTQFWRPFFEAAARTKLSDPYGTEQSIIAECQAELHPAENSLEFDQPSVGQVTDQGTPRQPSFTRSPGQSAEAPTPRANDSAVWPGAPVMSPLESLQSDWRRIAASPDSAAGVDLEAVRHGISALGVNPGALESPSLAMPNLSLDNSPTPSATSAPKASTSSLEPPRSPGGARLRAGADRHHPALLQKVLNKQLLSPRPPGASTPAKGRAAFPSDIPRGWNGVTDLAETSLSAFPSPIKRSTDAADESWAGDFGATSVAGGSPAPLLASPPPMAYALSPAKYAPTPAKDAARRTAKFAYDAEEDDLAPPSVLKNYTTRYDFTLDQGGSPVAPSPSEGLRKGFEEEAYGDDDDEEEEDEKEEESVALPAHLADYGGGTTARIDDLLAGGDEFVHDGDFGGLVVDDEGVRPHLEEDDDEEYDGGYDENAEEGEVGEESYVVEEGISQDIAPSGPEDTLFGMQKKVVGFEDGNEDEENDSFAAGAGSGGQFMMMGPGVDDMQTLHGGDVSDNPGRERARDRIS